MRAGRLRHRITVLAPKEPGTQDPFGDELPGYATETACWGDITAPDPGREYQQADRTTAETTYQIRLRYYGALTTRHRLEAGGKTYEIESVADPSGRRRELVVTAKVSA